MTALRHLLLFLAIALSPLSVMAVPVDINTADAAMLAGAIKGVGLSKAQAIIEYRQKHGRFGSVDELSRVRGIGKRTVELNRANLRVEPPDQATTAK